MFKRMLLARETQVRFWRFVTVGAISALVQLGCLAVLKRWFTPTLAFSVSFIMSTATHYSLNRFWALPSERCDRARQLTEYLATAGLSYLVNISLFNLCLHVIGLGVMWSAVLAVPPSTLMVFLLLNYRVFRRLSPPPGD
jgi:putative flippase GtrA